MNEYDLDLDDNGDINVDNSTGNLKIVEDDECTAQRVENTLNTYKGEFFTDEEHGTEYFGRILGNTESVVIASEGEEVIQSAVLQEPEVVIVESVEVKSDGRSATVGFEGVLKSGNTITVGGVEIGKKRRMGDI